MAALTTGDPTDPATTYGPLSSEAAAPGLMAQVEDAVDKGATVRTGGTRVDGAGCVRRGHGAHRRDAARCAPSARSCSARSPSSTGSATSTRPCRWPTTRRIGLGGAVYHSDPAVALDVADRLDTGMVWINEPEGGGRRAAVRRHEALRRRP